MNRSSDARQSYLRSAAMGALLAGMLAASPALAQTADPDDSADQAAVQATDEVPADEPQAIVVTGSRIARPNLDSPVPVTSVEIENLQSGNVSLGDSLNQLPALRSTYSQANSTAFIGTSGLNLLDLRGLGTSRTLTLVNGRRVVTSDPGTESVDTNTIPDELVERVDVVTGGNSAVYGSDAVAGVVNFILKDDFEGLEAGGQGGVSSRGDRQSYRAYLTAGKNFFDGRANLTVSVGYAKADALYYTDRDARYGGYSGRHQFNRVQDTIGEPATGDGIPDTAFLTGVKNNNISNGGLITSTCPAPVPESDPAFGVIAAVRAQNCTGEMTPTGGRIGRTYVFDSTGTLVANPVINDLRNVGSSNSIGGLGSTLLEGSQLDPAYERKTANVLAHYELSEAADLFFRGSYVDIGSVQAGQPTFEYNVFNINNPYLTDQNEALLRAIYGAGPNEDFNFGAYRFNTDFGARGENHDRETFNLVGGIRGDFNDDWHYELAATYGETTTFYQTEGNINENKYFNSASASRDASGNIVCSINADSDPTNDDPACVPINLFGAGLARTQQAALDYFGVTSTRNQKATLFDVTGYVSGDSSQFFELPGGPVSFSIGGEFRKSTAFSAYDDVTKSGVTFLNVINDFDPPALEVTEGFGELSIPLLADMPFVRELTVNAAGRVSHYNVGSTGTVFAWNLGGTYAPVDSLRFRLSYAKSVRAPSLSNLFDSRSQTYLLVSDPCDQANINDNPNRVANCAADGVPTTVVDPATGDTIPFTNRPSSSIAGFNGGNADLNEETGYSFTVGGVYEPTFLPGFSVTVDYYNIRLDNVIYTLGGQTLIDQCYDAPGGIDNPYCAAVNRREDGTFAGQSDRIINGITYQLDDSGSAFEAGPFNFAKQETSGIDLTTNYRQEFGEGVSLNLKGLLSYVIKRNNYTDINDPDFKDRQLSELGDPVWAGSLFATLNVGKFDLYYKFQYVGKQTIGEYETQNSFQGRPPENPDAYPVAYYPDLTYHDIRLGFEPTDIFRFYVGVDNLFDKQPPFGADGTAPGSTYDNIGRFFYAGARVTF
ncbi:TonB-dependent receptor domain-containing protein [Stakelama saccharophila]|uniref:TonB-dependent receptor n=1 Tax=Stakelama saccharophila TaxID=3075605 RepID=A0ABZ0B8K8_9SPHN|nr:TonB-dependent receptor [Stakelama sp. W311]WNO53365.1 TonB-dependent receptor [Stakelama sp. W311]